MALTGLKNRGITDDTITEAKWGGGQFGRKNLIINGAMQVWQRGTSTTSTGTKTADRWNVFTESGSLTSVERSTDVPTNKPFEYSVKITGTNVVLRHWIERPLQFQTGAVLTWSAWVKGTAGNTFSADISDRHNEGYTCTGDWEFITKTFTVGSDRDVDAYGTYGNQHLNIIRGTSAGAYYVTGVQLEVGSVATPFEHRSYGEELALCQRYYYQLGGTHEVIGAAYSPSTSEVGINFYFPVTMRTTPTVSVSNITNFEFRKNNNTAYVFSGSGGANVTYMTPEGGSYWRNGEGLGASGFAGEVRTRNATTGYIYFEAEIGTP